VTIVCESCSAGLGNCSDLLWLLGFTVICLTTPGMLELVDGVCNLLYPNTCGR